MTQVTQIDAITEGELFSLLRDGYLVEFEDGKCRIGTDGVFIAGDNAYGLSAFADTLTPGGCHRALEWTRRQAANRHAERRHVVNQQRLQQRQETAFAQ